MDKSDITKTNALHSQSKTQDLPRNYPLNSINKPTSFFKDGKNIVSLRFLINNVKLLQIKLIMQQ